MTKVVVRYVDVYVARRKAREWDILLLRRARGRTRAGSWEAVHGTIERGEKPARAARRELTEETGLEPLKFYNLSRVEAFYEHRPDRVALIPVFAAIVPARAVVTVADEHDAYEWLPPGRAQQTCVWPRSARAIGDLVRLLTSGSAGTVEDMLRVD